MRPGFGGLFPAFALAVVFCLTPIEAGAQSPAVDTGKQDEKRDERSRAERAEAARKAKEAAAAEAKAKEEATAAERALDNKILGAWSLVVPDANRGFADADLVRAANGCATFAKIEKFSVEPGAERVLPAPRERVGSINYLRTEAGLQRFEPATGTMYLLSDATARNGRNGVPIWRLAGPSVVIDVAFSKREGTKIEYMLENQRLYLRCPNAIPAPEGE